MQGIACDIALVSFPSRQYILVAADRLSASCWRIISPWLSAPPSPTSWPNVINLTINARHLIILRNSALVFTFKILESCTVLRTQMNIHSIQLSHTQQPIHINIQQTTQESIARRANKFSRLRVKIWSHGVLRERRKGSTIYGRFMAAYSPTHTSKWNLPRAALNHRKKRVCPSKVEYSRESSWESNLLRTKERCSFYTSVIFFWPVTGNVISRTCHRHHRRSHCWPIFYLWRFKICVWWRWPGRFQRTGDIKSRL